MDESAFLSTVRDESGIDADDRLEAGVVASLVTLAERITQAEATDLAAQLPAGFREITANAATGPQVFDRDELIRRVSQRSGLVASEATALVSAVFLTLSAAVSEGEIDDVKAQLPADIASLFAEPIRDPRDEYVDLIELEHEGWQSLTTSGGDAASFYDTVLADEALMVLVGGMVLDERSEIIESMTGPGWDAYGLTSERVLVLSETSAVVTYRACAQRAGSQFDAWCTSTYVYDGDVWRLALHQQTPV